MAKRQKEELPPPKVVVKPEPKAWERRFRPKKIEGLKHIEALDYLIWKNRSFVPGVNGAWLDKDLAKRGMLLFVLQKYELGKRHPEQGVGIDFVYKFVHDRSFRFRYYYMQDSWYRLFYLENRWKYVSLDFEMYGLNKPKSL